MSPDVADKFEKLDQIGLFDYFKKRSMPEFAEPYITEIVEIYVSAPNTDRERLLKMISGKNKAGMVFGWYARKLAARAVRYESQRDLRNGLIAIVIACEVTGSRDLLSPLCLLYDAALRLQVDPQVLFGTTCEGSPPVERWLAEFLARTPEQRSIKAFGFSEGVGPHGFDYLPLLAEYGGPTPLG